MNTCLTFVTRAFAPLRLFALQHSLEAHSPSRQAAHGQEGHPTPTDGLANQKTLIVATERKSDSVVAVPPITSVSIDLRAEKKLRANAIDLPGWIAKEAALNGLQSADVLPWHVVMIYDQFDEDGDNVHSGVYEEYWAGEKKYKRIYKSDNFNQTDYATDSLLTMVQYMLPL